MGSRWVRPMGRGFEGRMTGLDAHFGGPSQEERHAHLPENDRAGAVSRWWPVRPLVHPFAVVRSKVIFDLQNHNFKFHVFPINFARRVGESCRTFCF